MLEVVRRSRAVSYVDLATQGSQLAAHGNILNSTLRSNASVGSSVPVPMMFSRNPTPLVFVRAINFGVSAASF